MRFNCVVNEDDNEQISVAFVSQWFPPEPGDLSLDIASSLNESLGVTVNVITGIPNYPTGKVLPGYRAWKPVRDVIAHMKVRRAPLFPSHNRSPIGRALNYSTFAISASIFAFRDIRKADVSLVYSSPVTATLPALLARAIVGKPYVAIVQDLWPDVVFDSGMLSNSKVRSFLTWPLNYFSMVTYKNADHLFAITPGMRSDLIERGVKEESVSVFLNWAPDADAKIPARSNLLRSILGIPRQDVLLLYAGNMGVTHALDSWVEAISETDRDAKSDQRRRVHLVFVGSGVEKAHLERLANELKARTIYFLDRADDEEFQQYKADADAIIVSLIDTPGLNTSLPSKVQSGLASGSIMIGTVKGDTANVIKDAGGLIAESFNVLSIRKVIDVLLNEDKVALDERRVKAKAYYDRTLSKSIGLPKLIEALKRASSR